LSTQLKFDGPHLDEVLERVGRELGPQAVIVEANRGRRGGVGGFFAREWFEVVVEAPAPPAAIDDAPRSLMSDEALLSLADEVNDEVGHHATSGMVAEPTFARVLARVGSVSDQASSVAAGSSAPSIRSRPSAPIADVESSDAPAPSRAASVPGAAAVRESNPARVRSLRDLDLRSMLAVLDETAAPVATALDRGTNAIVAVVGDLSAARPVAEAIATRAGLAEDDVLVASPTARDDVPSWLRIDGAATATARVDRWRRRERPIVVAVDLTPGRDGHVWAAEVLAAMGADEVRLVARAWQVTDELAPKAAVLGGVDGLELVDVEAAGEPESFLDLDIPVLGIDGRAATPELWAALMLERRNDVAV
jgi:hypothetical protein